MPGLPPLPPQLELTRRRTEEWLAASDPVGKPYEDLVAAATAREILVRVVARDGKSLAVTADLRLNRVNVRVEAGLVTRVDGVY